MNKTLQIPLSIDDANLVLQALGALPHNQVRALIDRIAQEAQQQIAAAQTAAAVVEKAAGEPETDPIA